MEINEIQRGTKSVTVSLIVKFQHINTLCPHLTMFWYKTTLKMGERGLSQIFCGLLSENLEKNVQMFWQFIVGRFHCHRLCKSTNNSIAYINNILHNILTQGCIYVDILYIYFICRSKCKIHTFGIQCCFKIYLYVLNNR